MKRKNTAKASVTQAADSVIDLAESLLGNPTSTANRLAAAVRRLAVTAVSAMTSRAAPAMLWHAGEHDWRRSSEIDNTMRQPSSVSPHRLGTCGREARQRDAATRRQHQEQLSEQEQQPFVRRGCTGVRQRRHASDAATPPRAARARPTLRGLNSSAPPTPYSVSSPGPRTRPLPEPALPCTGAAVTREASNRARGTWARYRPAGCTAGRCSAVGLVLAAGRECVLSAPRWSAAMFKTLKRVLSMSLRVLSVCRVFMAHASSKMNGRMTEMIDALRRELEIWLCYNHTRYIRRARTRRRATRQYRLTRSDGTQAVVTYIRQRDGTYVALAARVQRAQTRAVLAAADEANRTARRTLRQQRARGPPGEGRSPARSGVRCARRARKLTDEAPGRGGYRCGGRNATSNHVGRVRQPPYRLHPTCPSPERVHHIRWGLGQQQTHKEARLFSRD